MDHSNSISVCREKLRGFVRRAVIDDDNLEFGPILCERAIDRFAEQIDAVVGGDDDGDARRIHWSILQRIG